MSLSLGFPMASSTRDCGVSKVAEPLGFLSVGGLYEETAAHRHHTRPRHPGAFLRGGRLGVRPSGRLGIATKDEQGDEETHARREPTALESIPPARAGLAA